ncbi:hypothetical protein [Acidovorax sp. LjRoot117]|uniref:hypothetical protein n=1 Tax=Acidovorax sp. LjRoot117 TaxID=3342255 RepID=UPI003ECCC1EE
MNAAATPVRKTARKSTSKPVNPPASLSTASERTVATTGADLMRQAAALVREEDGGDYADPLLEFGQKALCRLAEGLSPECTPRDVFLSAAAACQGALAIDRSQHPVHVPRHQLMLSAFELLSNAALSYDTPLRPCVEAAAAIDAGARWSTNLEGEDADILGDRAMAANELVSWIIAARVTLEQARKVVAQCPEVEAAMRRHFVAINSPIWGGCEEDNALQWLLQDQRRQIAELAKRGAA